jgi:hypothetical protein
MKLYREKNASVAGETYMPPLAQTMGESPKARICDLEEYIEQEQKEIRIKETVPPSNRRRRLRIYIPSLPLK